MAKLSVAGTSVKRARIEDKVTGSLQYATDRVLPGMLHARFLRSPHARADIRRISTDAAAAVNGVELVLTAADLPQPVVKYGPVEYDQPVLADGEVKYQGEAVAVVVARSAQAAEAALKKITVAYRVKKPVVTVEQALAEHAPRIHADRKDNVYKEWKYDRGNIDGVNRKNLLVLENEYRYPMVFHFAIEPHACLAAPDEDGVRIYTPVQHPFMLRRVVSDVLGIPLSKVRVTAEEMGGAFGGKGYPKMEPLAAYLAMRFKRPVQFKLSLNESFRMGRRTGARVRIRTGFDKNGKIRFQDIEGDYLMGAYLDAAPRLISKAGYTGSGLYKTPHARIRTRGIYSNTVPSTAFRGFGMPQLVLALESQMNLAARQLKIDPLEIRLRNLPDPGTTLFPGDKPVDGDWKQGLRKAAELIGWGTPLKPNRGRGLSIGMKSGIHASVSNAVVKLHADGSVTVNAGTTEMGQGARTVLGQVAAECLGVPYERVRTDLGDTGTAPYDSATAGSRGTVSMGSAIADACDDILKQLETIAVKLYPAAKKNCTFADGAVKIGRKQISYPDLVKAFHGVDKGELIGRGMFKGKVAKGHPLGGHADFWETIFVGVETEIDPATGKLRITRYGCVSDIGKVINPIQAEGQDEGGTLMGLGQAMMEQLLYSEDGSLKNGTATDYCIPTVRDIPSGYRGVFIENGDGPGPFGAKGLGEASAIPVGPAVTGAVYDATGILFREIPVTPERLYKALNGKA